jgi:hypothetical protein
MKPLSQAGLDALQPHESSCGTYLYSLTDDTHSDGFGTVMFVLTHPQASVNLLLQDVDRARRLRDRWGYERMIIGYAYARRTDDPAALETLSDPVGPRTDSVLLAAAYEAQRVVLTWDQKQSAERLGDVGEMIASSRVFVLPTTLEQAFQIPPGQQLAPYYLGARSW